jgi:hypothetical protein
MTDRAVDRDGSWIVYEWATIRIVPRVHTEQFVAAGVILHARQAHFLEARTGAHWEERLRKLAPELDRERLRRHLESYVRIARGDEGAGPIALLPPSERFHWLIHPRSAILQTSPAHPGRCHDPGAAIACLFEEQCR